jgi:ribosomal protein L20A (L18A)
MRYKNKYTFQNSVTKLTVVIHALTPGNATEVLLQEIGSKTLSEDWKLTRIEVKR